MYMSCISSCQVWILTSLETQLYLYDKLEGHGDERAEVEPEWDEGPTDQPVNNEAKHFEEGLSRPQINFDGGGREQGSFFSSISEGSRTNLIDPLGGSVDDEVDTSISPIYISWRCRLNRQ